jgi:hypothetical protein
MAAVELTKSAWEVLKADAAREIENAILERHTFRGSEEGDRQESTLLACADVIGALGRWAPEDTGKYEFTPAALDWMAETLGHTKDHLEHLDTSEEGPLDYTARQAYLVHVIGRILGARSEAVAV